MRLRLEIYNRDGGACKSCGLDCRYLRWSIDHIVPHRLKGGAFWDTENLQLLCYGCHKIKSDGELRELRNRTAKQAEWDRLVGL